MNYIVCYRGNFYYSPFIDSPCTIKSLKEHMLQDQNCPFTRTMNTFFDKVERIEHPDSLVNYGLILMLPLLMVSVWLSSWSTGVPRSVFHLHPGISSAYQNFLLPHACSIIMFFVGILIPHVVERSFDLIDDSAFLCNWIFGKGKQLTNV